MCSWCAQSRAAARGLQSELASLGRELAARGALSKPDAAHALFH